jgi:ribosomal-protein-alanine N-acetyltransferase
MVRETRGKLSIRATLAQRCDPALTATMSTRLDSKPRADIAATLATLPSFPRLQGKRVCLRAPVAEDADAVFALFGDPDVMRYWSRPPMTSRSEAEGLIAEILDGFSQRTILNWMVVSRQDDALIGTCALFRVDARHRRAEIGYSLRRDHWGRGLAAEAVSLMLDWSFRTLALHRVEADIDPRNDGSRRLLERLGFSSEGLLRERYFVGDEISDTELFGLLASDWIKRSS